MIHLRGLAIVLAMGLSGPMAVPAAAQTAPQAPRAEALAEMMEATRLRPLLAIISREVSTHGQDIEASLFPGRGGASWAAEVDRLRDTDAVFAIIAETLRQRLTPEDIAAVSAFYRSAVGQKVIAGEVAARQRMLDETEEATARDTARALRDAGALRMQLVDALIEAIDLVDANVASGMNANFWFYRGMAEGEGALSHMSEADLLQLVQSQRAEMQAETMDWLDGYLVASHMDLSNEELAEYVIFAESTAGQRFNAALFEGYGESYEAISYALGRAAARFMEQTDL